MFSIFFKILVLYLLKKNYTLLKILSIFFLVLKFMFSWFKKSHLFYFFTILVSYFSFSFSIIKKKSIFFISFFFWVSFICFFLEFYNFCFHGFFKTYFPFGYLIFYFFLFSFYTCWKFWFYISYFIYGFHFLQCL